MALTLWRIVLIFATYTSVNSSNSNCSENCECPSTIEAKCSKRTSIPEDLSEELEILSLVGGNIPVLPNNASENKNLKRLRNISIIRSKVKTIEERAFYGLTELQIVDLNSNSIKRLHIETFEENPLLSSINLHNNPLNTTGDIFLRHVPSLRKLDLSFCRILHIPENYFNGLLNLTNLILKDNNLHFLSVNVFQKLHHLENLDLRYNNWNCSCDLQPLFGWYTQRFSKEINEPGCDLNQTSWYNIDFICDDSSAANDSLEGNKILQGTTMLPKDPSVATMTNTIPNEPDTTVYEVIIGVLCALLAILVVVYITMKRKPYIKYCNSRNTTNEQFEDENVNRSQEPLKEQTNGNRSDCNLRNTTNEQSKDENVNRSQEPLKEQTNGNRSDCNSRNTTNEQSEDENGNTSKEPSNKQPNGNPGDSPVDETSPLMEGTPQPSQHSTNENEDTHV